MAITISQLIDIINFSKGPCYTTFLDFYSIERFRESRAVYYLIHTREGWPFFINIVTHCE